MKLQRVKSSKMEEKRDFPQNETKINSFKNGSFEMEPLNLRLTPYEKSVISHAASIAKLDIYRFSVRLLREKAENILKDFFEMDDERWSSYKRAILRRKSHFGSKEQNS